MSLTINHQTNNISTTSGSMTLDGADINLTATTDINIPANVGLTFGDDGEKIEGNGTDLTINSSNDLNLTATTDINIPANVGLTFGDDGEKIEGDGTALTITSSQRLFLDAADDVFIDAADDIILDAGDDIILDAAGVTQFRAGGTSFFQASYPSADGNVYLYHMVADGHLKIGGIDGFSIVHAIDIDFAAAGAVAFNSSITSGGAAVKVAGKESIYVPAAAMYPSTTNPCSGLTQVETTALRPDLKVLDFADGADDFAQFTIAFPKSWNEGTVTFQPFWTVTGTNTGTVAWQLAAVAITNDESINTAFGTQVATTALAFSGTSNDLMVSAESGAVTIAGSPAANDMCFFQINRDVSADTQSGAARLVGIKILFTTDAANDV